METNPSPELTRREGVEACPVVLADGQLWGLALPSTRLRPEVVEGIDELGRPCRSIRVATVYGYPLEIRRLIEDLRSDCGRGDPGRPYESLIRLASALIRRAHDVDPEVAASLLDVGVEDLPGFVEAVVSVVFGAWSEPGRNEKG